jgi:hypothetical protein
LVFTWRKLQAVQDYNIHSDSDLEGTQFEGGEMKIIDELDISYGNDLK